MENDCEDHIWHKICTLQSNCRKILVLINQFMTPPPNSNLSDKPVVGREAQLRNNRLAGLEVELKVGNIRIISASKIISVHISRSRNIYDL